MRLEQPSAPDAPPKAATALELAIYEFEKKCDAHHATMCLPTPANETPQEREKRLRDWHEAREHLERERRRINTLANIEDGLLEYRKEFNVLTSSQRLAQMTQEQHHPTTLLAKHLTATGEPKPSKQHAAHHIVPGKGRWKQSKLLLVRLKLHQSGIRINDPRNGLWLPNLKKDKGHWATPQLPVHKSVHGINYEQWVSTELGFIPTGTPFEHKLRGIKTNLKNGVYPIKIEESKDPDWSGKP